MKQINRIKIKTAGALRQRGFTLLELLVVLGIIAMLAGIVGPQVMKHMGESKTKAARVQIEDLAAALDMYKLDLGRYPTSEQGLSALIESPDNANRWNGPYLRKAKMPLDPWQQEYRYVSPGEHGKFDLYTLGADGKEGGEGEDQDIVSWE
ncbi:MAG: type II secretion system major pseudopilin GspG [Methylobacter sp.]|nr:type II secretion system major pseudopilin GspG [Methylobacter sp.]